jgi:hypothetical protein
MPSPTPALTKQAFPTSGPWRHVITVRTNIRRHRGTRLANDLSDTLAYALKPRGPYEIVILPLTWRDPAAVAMNTLMALWLIAYYSDLVFGGRWPDPQFVLASLDGADLYREALERNATGFYDWLVPIFERDAVRLFGPKPVLDREKVVFDWIDNS